MATPPSKHDMLSFLQTMAPSDSQDTVKAEAATTTIPNAVDVKEIKAELTSDAPSPKRSRTSEPSQAPSFTALRVEITTLTHPWSLCNVRHCSALR